MQEDESCEHKEEMNMSEYNETKANQHLYLDEMMADAKKTMHEMLDRAYLTGALTDEMKEDNYLLAKAVITIWSRKESYAPIDKRTKAEVKNLEHFI